MTTHDFVMIPSLRIKKFKIDKIGNYKADNYSELVNNKFKDLGCNMRIKVHYVTPQALRQLTRKHWWPM